MYAKRQAVQDLGDEPRHNKQGGQEGLKGSTSTPTWAMSARTGSAGRPLARFLADVSSSLEKLSFSLATSPPPAVLQTTGM